jgi:K+-transporting ATPase A subunit
MTKRKDRQYNGQKKGQTMIYKTLHRKLKIEQQKPRGELGPLAIVLSVLLPLAIVLSVLLLLANVRQLLVT